MFKVLWLLKRRPGMSMREFVDYYENTHSKLIKYMPGVRRYFRRYISPLVNAPGSASEDFDVLMEMWFDDRAAFDAARAALQQPEVAAIVQPDEDKFLDRSRIRAVVAVEEHETALPKARGSQP